MAKVVLRFLATVLGLIGSALCTAAPQDAFFESKVRPALQSCIACHGRESASGGLRLDRAITAMQAQEVLKRVRGEGGKDRMPLNAPPLTREQLASPARMPTRSWSIDCSPRRTTGRSGGAPGWI